MLKSGRLPFCLLAVIWCSAVGAQVTPPGWITSGAFRDFHVVMPQNANDLQRHGAEVFQRQFKDVTGREIGIGETPEGLINVWLGPAAVSAGLLRDWDLQDLAPEEYLIRTYDPHARLAEMGAAKQLVIAGATDTGTLHGVYDFFRRFMDFRWLAPGVTAYIPPRFTFPAIDFRYTPPFPFRELALTGVGADAAEFREAHHLLQPFDRPRENTLRALLPPEKYFGDHPEFFGLREGRRHAEGVQPCLSNEALATAAASALRGLILADDDSELRKLVQWRALPDTWTLSLDPDAPACACPACTALIEETGSLSGLLIGFLNRISAELEAALPDTRIRLHTLASGRLRRPPRDIEVADKVLVQVSAREADYSRPLEDRESAINLALRRDLDGWSGLTRQLYVWDFAANLSTPLTPHPNLAHIQVNLQFYDQFLVQGVYADGWAGLPFSELDALRQYLYAIHLWDPDYGIEKARRDFFRDYYVQALAPMMAYVDLITKKVEDEGVYLACTQDAYWFDFALVEESRALFEEALAQRMTEEVQRRVQQTQLPVEWAAMVCPPRITVEGDALHFERPPCLSFVELESRMREAWPAVAAEDLEAVLSPLRAALPGGVPPREEQHPFSVLENERYLIWIAPSIGGAVVRFQDKATKTELLRGFRNSGAGVWAVEAASAGNGVEALDWTLKEATADAVALEAKESRGITFIRTIRLEEQSVVEEVTLSNVSKEGVSGNLRTGPELFIQARHADATCWTRQAGAWQHVAHPENPFGIARGESRLAPAAAHAVYLAAPNLTFRAEVVGDPAPALFTYDGEHQHQMARLQTASGEYTLAPGESARFALRYTVAPGTPDTSGSADEAGQP